MRDLLPQVQQWLDSGDRVAVATVVRVTGSAPRPAGARMFVSASGLLTGSISGGCVETAVYEEMMQILAGGPPRLLRFGITEDMIWDVGLACGGQIDVFIQLLDPDLLRALSRRMAKDEAGVLATCLRGDCGPGAWTLVTTEGRLAGLDDPRITSAAEKLLASSTAATCVVEAAPGMELFMEPLLPAPHLVIIGAGHIAIPLTRLAKELDFRVSVIDPRAKFASRERFPEADAVLAEWPEQALARLHIDERTYVALLSHDSRIDEPALAAILSTRAAYVGAMGSRRTHRDRLERLVRSGITAEALRRVHSPIGLRLGGKTPQEIALSIIAEIVAVKNAQGSASEGSIS